MNDELPSSRTGAADGLLQRLVDHAPVMIAACDSSGVYLYANDAFAHACGCSVEAIVGRRGDALSAGATVPPWLRPGNLPAGTSGTTIVEGEIGGRRTRVLTVRYRERSADGDAPTCLIANELAIDDEIRSSLDSAVDRNTELLRALEQMERLAYTDRLTGAWNRRHLDDAALIEMSRAERHGFPVSVLMLDIDHFKEFNDRLGHPAGDRVLIDVVRCVRSGIRRADTVTRWGGEEFVVLAPDTPLHEAERLAQKLCSRIAASLHFQPTPVTVSIGVAEYQCGEGFERWFARVDHALYRAKTGGRNRVVADSLTAFHERGNAQRAASPVRLVWHDSYRCGNDDVDRQHRTLFDHANVLLDAVGANAPREWVLELTRALVDAIAEHFADEERLHGEIGFPDRHAHAAEHSALLAKARQLIELAECQALPMPDLFQFVAYEVVTHHLLGADRRYFPYLETGTP